MNIRCTPSVLQGEKTLKDNNFSNLILLCCGALSQNGITLHNFSSSEKSQKLLDLISYMGANVTVNENSVTVSKNRIFGAMVNVKGESEIFALYCALASICDKGFTLLTGVKTIDTYIVNSMIENLNKIRVASSFDDENEIVIWGENEIVGGTVDANCDPYLALAFTLISCKSNLPIDIHNIGNLTELFPNFIDEFNALGGKIEIIK